MTQIVYVYGFSRPVASIPALQGVREGEVRAISDTGLSAICSAVDAADFSQESIDQHSGDLQWLGEIGFDHQRVVSQLSRDHTIVPVRAFTLFQSDDSLREYLTGNAKELKSSLDRLEGKEEWTIRIELDAGVWAGHMAARVPALKTLLEEISNTSKGRAYLLQRKLEEQKKAAAREAEDGLIGEIAAEVATTVGGERLVENRQQRGGSFPQINILIARDQATALQQLHQKLDSRYRHEGVSLILTGPWPPYSFASERAHG